MGTTIIFRRGENDPTSGSGLTLAEPAFNTTLKTFHIGLGHGVTAAWVGAPISGLSAEIAAGITYKIPTAAAVKNYIGGLCYGNTGAATITQYVSSFNGLTGAVQGVSAAVAGTGISVSGATGAVTITNTGVQSFNGATGAVTGASLGANTFTGLQTLNAGLSASAVYVSTGSTFAGLVTFTNGVSAAGTITLASPNLTGTPTAPTAALGTNTTQIATTAFVQSEIVADTVTAFNGRTGAVQGVSAAVAGTGISVSGATGSVTITNIGVQSFNGNTGAVTGASLGANTFTGLNSFNAGISAYGGTFSDQVRFINGLSATYVRIGSLESNNSNPVTLSENRFRFTVLGFPSVYTTLQADSNTSADRTITLPDASGTVALTSQLMGAVNGSTAATTAVTSFNGLTGAVGGVCAAQANTFTALNTFNAGISAAGGVTLSGTLQGTTASFTGLVSSTVGFSGSATNLVGNANGLTAGTASRVQIAEGQGSVYPYYLVLAGGAGNTGIFVDTSAPRWEYNTSTGGLATTTGYLEAATLNAAIAIYSNYFTASDSNAPINIRASYNDGTYQPIYIGDTTSSGDGTLITVDDAASKIEFTAGNIDAYGNLNVKDSAYLTFYDTDVSNYVAFRGPTALAANTLWTLPSADGSANQVLTTNGSGTLSWSTPSGGGSSVTSFNGLTGAVTGVSRVNGFTGGITFAASTGITFTASAGTITLSTTGGGGSKTYAVFTPLDNQPPASNFATLDTRNSIAVLDFDAATDESAIFVGVIPEGASLGSGLKIRISWMATSATSGACRWGVQIERMNTDEDSDSFDTDATGGSTTNATSGIITTTEITITTIDSVAAGEPFRLKVYRDADGTSGTDDMTGDAELVSVEVRSAS